MSLAVIILLIVLGIVLLVLEILVVPGGLLGIIAFGMIGFGVYSIYSDYGTTAGHIGLVVSVTASISAVYFSLKSNAWKKITLTDAIDGKMNTIDETMVKVGDVGTAISDLRPMGTALFNDEKFEVSSEGEKIPVHSAIEILRIEGNKIIVQKTDK